MKTTRFQILCKDNVWRWVFCRSQNTRDLQTGSQVIATEREDGAYVSYGPTQPEKDLDYFLSHANGAQVRISA